MPRLLTKLFLLLLNLLICSYVLAANDLNEASANEDSAAELQPIYHVYEDIDLIPTIQFKYSKPKIVIKSVYPLLTSDSENLNVEDFNLHMDQLIKQEVTYFKNEVAAIQPMQRNSRNQKNDLNIDFATSIINIKSHPLVSIRLNIQGYVYGTMHAYHHHTVFNYDLKSGKTLTLMNLFRPEVNYLHVISEYSRNILLKRLPDKEMVLAGTQPTEENFRNWNLKPKGLLITFDEHQVAPYAYGSQTVFIPYSALQYIIDPRSLLNVCIQSRKKCLQNKLLTGGFTEDAGA